MTYSIRKKNHTMGKKRWLTIIDQTFFLNNILPIFPKWCTQDTQDYIRNKKNCQKSHPCIFRRPPKYTQVPIFRKMKFFGLTSSKSFFLLIFLINLKMKVLPIQLKINVQSPKILYLKALADQLTANSKKMRFLGGFTKKQSKLLKNTVFDYLV